MPTLKSICPRCSKIPDCKVVETLRRNPRTEQWEMTPERVPLFNSSPCATLDTLYAIRNCRPALPGSMGGLIDKKIKAQEAHAKAHGHPIAGSIVVPARVVHPTSP